MSRPRKPFGTNLPGRLPATMVKVLAAEMSDQGRLSRGKRYWNDGAVIDIVIGHGAVTAEIRGSRREPYIVTIDAKPGSGVPAKRDVRVRCTCPDDSGSGREACKHAVAALFTLSDEIAIEPDVIDRWRGGMEHASGDTDDREIDDENDAPSNVVPIRPGIETSRPMVRPAREMAPIHDTTIDEIAAMLAAPSGAPAPVFPVPGPVAHAGIRDPLLAEVMRDVLDHLAINWD